jgi:hypothetical protein
VARDVVEQRELGESSVTSSENSARAQRRAVRARRELSDEQRELGDERRELGEESPAWPKPWSSSESSATSLTRSDKSSVKILQYKYVEQFSLL